MTRNCKSWLACAAVAVVLGINHQANADSGMFGGFIEITGNSPATWYDLQEFELNALDPFEGADLGDYDLDTDSLQITNSEGLTFKNGGSDVTGVETNYRVTKVGDAAGGFSTVAHNFGANAPSNAADGNAFGGTGDQSWGNLGDIVADIDVLALVSGPGNYELEVFLRAFTSDGDRFINAGGSNFTATFTVVPAPAALPAGLALMVGLAMRRRR